MIRLVFWHIWWNTYPLRNWGGGCMWCNFRPWSFRSTMHSICHLSIQQMSILSVTCLFNKCLEVVVDVDQSEPYNLFGLCLREEDRKLGDAFWSFSDDFGVCSSSASYCLHLDVLPSSWSLPSSVLPQDLYCLDLDILPGSQSLSSLALPPTMCLLVLLGVVSWNYKEKQSKNLDMILWMNVKMVDSLLYYYLTHCLLPEVQYASSHHSHLQVPIITMTNASPSPW